MWLGFQLHCVPDFVGRTSSAARIPHNYRVLRGRDSAWADRSPIDPRRYHMGQRYKRLSVKRYEAK